jgi:peptidoglycan/xylan/chitin deacetylase (PgdA/CDA1 family)
VALAAATVMATLAGTTVLRPPATRASGEQLSEPASRRPVALGVPTATEPSAATAPTEPPLPPPRPPDVLGPPGAKLAPVYFKVRTTGREVFLTIDDGWVPSQPALRLIRTRHVPVTAFLIDRAWRQHPAYFRALRAAGASLQDHTLTHPVLSHLGLAAQKRQICGAATRQATGLGVRPTLLRPPYGIYDHDTRRAAAACHLSAVVEWSATVDRARLVVVGGRLKPGDVILLHFTSRLASDLTVALAAIRRAHLTVGRLAGALGSAAATQS